MSEIAVKPKRIRTELEKTKDREYQREKYRRMTPEQRDLALAKRKDYNRRWHTPERATLKAIKETASRNANPERKEKFNTYHQQWMKNRSAEKKARSLFLNRQRHANWTPEQKAAHYAARRERELRSIQSEEKQEQQREWFRLYWASLSEEKRYEYGMKNHRRRARILSLNESYTLDEWISLLDKHGHRCAKCRRQGVQLTVDHVIPIIKGGNNTIDNIQPLCKSCNCSKGIKTIRYAV